MTRVTARAVFKSRWLKEEQFSSSAGYRTEFSSNVGYNKSSFQVTLVTAPAVFE